MNVAANIESDPALTVRMVEKPWGRDSLPAPFTAPDGKRIGEIWFEPPAALPELLVKYIFTSHKLSVQVHPSDAQTQAAGLGRQGKEECWLVIDAEPGATLGIGLTTPLSAAAMRAAAVDGSIERMLDWHPVKTGDFFYIPANTIHAIGAGVSVIEIQQNSDITYRLYDYGRPRELHLDQAIAVAKRMPYDAAGHRFAPVGTNTRLVEGPYFRLEAVAGVPDAQTIARFAGGPLLAIPVQGEIAIAGQRIAPGGCGFSAKIGNIGFGADGYCLLAAPRAGHN